MLYTDCYLFVYKCVLTTFNKDGDDDDDEDDVASSFFTVCWQINCLEVCGEIIRTVLCCIVY